MLLVHGIDLLFACEFLVDSTENENPFLIFQNPYSNYSIAVVSDDIDGVTYR